MADAKRAIQSGPLDLPGAGEPIPERDFGDLRTDSDLGFCPDGILGFWWWSRTRLRLDTRWRAVGLPTLDGELNLEREKGPIPPPSASIGSRASRVEHGEDLL